MKDKEKISKYNKEYRVKNIEKINKNYARYMKEYRELILLRRRNNEKTKERNKKYRAENAKLIKAANKKYMINNKGKINANTAKRRAKKLQATPNWLNKHHLSEIVDIYETAQEIKWLNEEPFHVDHIIPLQGKSVCGLHVPWNLQILTASKNMRKHNKLGE